ncbi:hypothetical protein GTY88_23895, partial [Streptomyces sp. SID5926]|nr:hypothetical protein [Streptomyces sp. SID5926]
MSPLLPPVSPSVTAELVAALTPRLRKRLDAGVAKVSGRPVVRDGDIVRIAVDAETDLELHAPDGIVSSAGAIRCGCLLAPDCLHRAAAASAAPVAESTEPAVGEPSPTEPAAGTPSPTEPPQEFAPGPARASTPASPPTSPPTAAPAPGLTPAPAPSAAQAPGAVPGDVPAPESATPAQCAASAALHAAAA